MNDSSLKPLLSVTVLNYNYAHFLPECLNSILNQTFTDFEVILINDKSTDNTLEVVQPYLADPRIRFINHEVNKGYVASLLEGCELSQGKYISVISADDYVLDMKAFEKALKLLEADPEIAFCFSAWNQVNGAGVNVHTRRSAEYDYVADGINEFRRLLMTSPVLHSGTMIRRSAYDAVGGYDSRCRYSVDTNMWLALCTIGKIAYINSPLYVYRAHETNLSNSGGAMWKATDEMLLGIDFALDRFSNQQLPDKAKLRRLSRKRALVAVPTMDIFARRLKRGWYGFWQAAKHYPAETILQSRTFMLILCTAIGSDNYHNIVNLLKNNKTNMKLFRRQA